MNLKLFLLSLMSVTVLADREELVTQEFHRVDTDSDGFLNADEMKAALEDIGAPADFDWTKYDEDGDGVLSLSEVHKMAEANKAALKARDGEALVQDEHEDEESSADDEHFEEYVTRDFKRVDKDSNGFLDEDEINAAFNDTGAPADFDWKEYDNDGDGALSLEEAKKAASSARAPHGEALVQEGHESSADDELLRSLQFEESVTQEFHRVDKDSNGFLNEDEIKAAFKDVGAPEDFDWKEYDNDGDGALSLDEVQTMALANKKAIKVKEPHGEALVQEGHEGKDHDEMVEKNSDVAEESSADDELLRSLQFEELITQEFHRVDKDKNEFLNEDEIKAAFKKVGAPEDFDWKEYDNDGDGVLSLDEVQTMALANKKS